MTWHVYILMQHQQLAILTMLYMVEHWERHLYTMEVVRNRETQGGRSTVIHLRRIYNF